MRVGRGSRQDCVNGSALDAIADAHGGEGAGGFEFNVLERIGVGVDLSDRTVIGIFSRPCFRINANYAVLTYPGKAGS